MTSWRLKKKFEQMMAAPEAMALDKGTVLKDNPYVSELYGRLVELEKVRCVHCSGFGHGYSQCPTGLKLRVLNREKPIWRTLYNDAVKHLCDTMIVGHIGKRMHRSE